MHTFEQPSIQLIKKQQLPPNAHITRLKFRGIRCPKMLQEVLACQLKFASTAFRIPSILHIIYYPATAALKKLTYRATSMPRSLIQIIAEICKLLQVYAIPSLKGPCIYYHCYLTPDFAR